MPVFSVLPRVGMARWDGLLGLFCCFKLLFSICEIDPQDRDFPKTWDGDLHPSRHVMPVRFASSGMDPLELTPRLPLPGLVWSARL